MCGESACTNIFLRLLPLQAGPTADFLDTAVSEDEVNEPAEG